MLLNLIKQQRPDIDKIYLYVKDPLLINKRGKVGIQILKNPKAFIDYSQTVDWRSNKEQIANMESNKNLSPIVTEMFLRGRKLNISLVFISQFYFKVPKTIRLNGTLFYHKNS